MLYRIAVTLCLYGIVYGGLWVMFEFTWEEKS